MINPSDVEKMNNGVNVDGQFDPEMLSEFENGKEAGEDE